MGSKRMFIEHLIFSLHFHGLFFLLFALALLIPWKWFDLSLIIGSQLYLYLAMRRVYQQGWWKTLLKHFLLTSSYNLVFLFYLAVMLGSSAALLEWSEKHPWLRVFLV